MENEIEKVELGVWPETLIFNPISEVIKERNAHPNRGSKSDGDTDEGDGGTNGDQILNLNQVNAQKDVCRFIINAIGGITVGGPKEGVRWRGQGSVGYRVESTATRKNIINNDLIMHERNAILKARKIGIDNAQHLSDWEILARLRHNGAPCRLIDITTDPFVALYMLCESTGNQDLKTKNGALVAFSMENTVLISKPWESRSYEKMLDRDQATLILEIPPIDPRIAAQRGGFIFSSKPMSFDEDQTNELIKANEPNSWDVDKLVKLCGRGLVVGKSGRPQVKFPNLVSILIPYQVKGMLMEILDKCFGYNRESIYPDWQGLANSFY